MAAGPKVANLSLVGKSSWEILMCERWENMFHHGSPTWQNSSLGTTKHITDEVPSQNGLKMVKVYTWKISHIRFIRFEDLLVRWSPFSLCYKALCGLASFPKRLLRPDPHVPCHRSKATGGQSNLGCWRMVRVNSPCLNDLWDNHGKPLSPQIVQGAEYNWWDDCWREPVTLICIDNQIWETDLT